MRRPSILTGALVLALVSGAAMTGSILLGGAGDGSAAAAVRAQEAADTTDADTIDADTVAETLPVDTLEEDEVAAITGAEGDSLLPAERAIQDHYDADRGPEQPIPFSHRWHAGELAMDCAYCHTDGRRTATVSMPSIELCMGCHQWVGRNLPPVGQLRSAWEEGQTIAWNRVYKLPEFVQFTHQPHLRNDVACQVCHGPVEEMDRVYKYSKLTMGWCLECHRNRPQPGDVATDFTLVREAEFPTVPAGRQEIGLYPRRIHTGYASQRAPQDCATCHY